MAKPQSPELRRSGRTPGLDQDNVATRLGAADAPTSSGPGGPVPPDNRPGHHPEHDQDKPDPRRFVERTHQRALRIARERAQAAIPGRRGAGIDLTASRGGVPAGTPPVAEEPPGDGGEAAGAAGPSRVLGALGGMCATTVGLARGVTGRVLRTAADVIDPRSRD